MAPIDDRTLAYLKVLHGGFNILVMALFFYQGLLGLRIRKSRKAGRPDAVSVRRHRRLGPVAAALGPGGFLAGLTLVYLDAGHALKHPLHFAFGAAIVVAISAAFALSRKIREAESPWRKRHMAAGFAILILYAVQAYLGLGIIF
ncbi:MAG: hypothetical protein Kow0025_07190 [Thermodesulfovibrionales bacterium]